MSHLRAVIGDFLSRSVAIRHDLHAHPELGYQEKRTSDLVHRLLTEWGVEHCGGLAGGTGVLARLPATGSNGGTVALRADMDALPITEETGVPYSSEHPGLMHACGHDGHTTILLSAVHALSKMPDRANETLFIFQPAEEGGAGGNRMCLDGVLDGRLLGTKADIIYGLHGFPNAKVGHVSTKVGPLMAAAAQLKITVHGKGAHAAYPHLGVDPIVVAAHIVTALQTIASRTVGPLDSVVVTIGKVEAGMAHNVIPETATLTGTLRTLQDDTEKTARAAVERIVRHTAEALGARAQVDWELVPYPVTRNEPAATERFRQIAGSAIGPDHVHEEPNPSMGGEDFSFYGRHIPACFFWLGIQPADATGYPNLHSPRFDFNDDAIPTGVELMCQLTLQPL